MQIKIVLQITCFSLMFSACLDKKNYSLYINYYGTLRYMTCAEIVKESPEFCFKYGSVQGGCDMSCINAGLAYGKIFVSLGSWKRGVRFG